MGSSGHISSSWVAWNALCVYVAAVVEAGVVSDAAGAAYLIEVGVHSESEPHTPLALA